MPAIVIAEFMDEGAIREHLADFDTHYDPALVDKPVELAALLADARALIVRNRTQVRGALLDAARKLACIGRLGVGLDNIDLDACSARGIAVYPASGANAVSVAEYVIGAILVLLRGVYRATPDVIAGEWPRNALIGREVVGRRLGLVGYGANARETAKRALALGMRVCAFDPAVDAEDSVWLQPAGRVEPQPLDAVIAQSDVLSLHAPLTAATRDLIGASAIARMKQGAILVNAARGGMVDEAALAQALKSGRLGGAALDVFAEEPLTAARGAVFAGCPNLVLTPHVAGVTEESNVKTSLVTALNVRRHLAGA
jgi:(S)-sulfolactate dehydrogenase